MKRGDLRKGISFCVEKNDGVDLISQIFDYSGARRYFFGVIPLYFFKCFDKVAYIVKSTAKSDVCD